LQLSIGFVLFLSLALLFGCTYFSLRGQLQQLRDDVEQLKAVHYPSLTHAAAARFLGDGDNSANEVSSPSQPLHHRSKREDTFNESAHQKDTFNVSTSQNDTWDSGEDGSGEVTEDNQYRGIWMGTYSRVPVSAELTFDVSLVLSMQT